VFVPWLGFPSGTGLVAFYRNEGACHFTKMTTNEVGALAAHRLSGWSCAWGDYDDDGRMDLIAVSGWVPSDRAQCLLYHNHADGTFSRVTTGSPANEVGAVISVNWVDYDQDGFLDLFCLPHDEEGAAWANRLYHNNGNSNAWLEVKCVGTSSPRFGTGAKVRVRATVHGKELWQLRLIDAGATPWGGQSFVAHFGLGDAQQVDTLRIEWPSGLVQERHGFVPRQLLTVVEPARLESQAAGAFRISSWRDMTAEVQSSTDLRTWTPLARLTNTTGRLEWQDPAAADPRCQFYRAVSCSGR
jgi:hypothetical protein